MRISWVALLMLGCRTDTVKGTETVEPIVTDADGDGFSVDDGDCDDNDAQLNPNATEVCDGFDNNCDGEIDEGVTQQFYADTDGDGFGDPENTTQGCDVIEGYVVVGNDCDDQNDTVYPAAEERCDGLDNDCDEDVDEGVGELFYVDVDGDGFGDSDQPVTQCDPELGLASEGGDCDDNNAQVSPNAYEICDGLDNDCDEDVDEGVMLTFYWDADEDGFGDPQQLVESCTQQQYHATNNDDCNDIDPLVNPLADEECDDEDNDCDGFNNEQGALGELIWYQDADGDGYGDVTSPYVLCDQPAGYVANYDDCDDGDAQVSPNAYEICNAIDDNCDGAVDESGAVGEQAFYADFDSDGRGDPNNLMMACTQPGLYTTNTDDCDDTNATVYLGATEVCDGLDNDCDNAVDVNAIDEVSYFLDDDGDGYGGVAYADCTPPSDAMYVGGDCDDNDATLNLDDADNDGYTTCDGDCDDASIIDNLDDADNDGYSTCDGDCDDGDAGLTSADDDGDGYSTCDGDCDDGDASLNLDDADGDGYTTCDGDCDDTESTASPVGVEDCQDGLDNDCDGFVDNGPLGESLECPASACADVSGSGLYYVDQGNGSDWYYCENDTDGGGWTLAYWVSYNHHTTTAAVSRSALGDLSTHAKLVDSEIASIAANGMGEVMVKDHHTSTIYIERYALSAWNSFSSTGWQNQVYDSKNSSGAWVSGCNGHVNNRGISTWSDNGYQPCPTTYQGSPKYFVTYHTSLYSGGVGGEYGVYVR